MPLYNYRCSEGHVVERVAPYGEPLIACPICAQDAERQVVSRPYITRFEEQVIENVRLSTDKKDMAYNEKRGFEPVKGVR